MKDSQFDVILPQCGSKKIQEGETEKNGCKTTSQFMLFFFCRAPFLISWFSSTNVCTGNPRLSRYLNIQFWNDCILGTLLPESTCWQKFFQLTEDF